MKFIEFQTLKDLKSTNISHTNGRLRKWHKWVLGTAGESLKVLYPIQTFTKDHAGIENM